MKLLWITTKYPFPADSGGKIVTRNLIKELSASGHTVSLYSLKVPSKEEPPPKQINLRTPPRSIKKDYNSLVKKITGFFSMRPYVINKYDSQSVSKDILENYKKENLDAVISDHIHTARYGLQIAKIKKIPNLLLEHNVESELWETLTKEETNPLKQLLLKVEELKVKKYEEKITKKIDTCVSLSKEDQEGLQNLNDDIAAKHISPGIYIKNYPYSPEGNGGNICLVGRMDWLPNINGAVWFMKEIWPLIKEGYKEAEFYIVGANPTKKIKDLNGVNGVTVTGRVPDIRAFIKKAQVFVVPVRSGSGVRIKILQGGSMGKAIVSTSRGCQGLDLVSGRDCYIKDEPEEFANSVVNLLQKERERKELGENAYNLVRKKYSARKACQQLEGIVLDQIKAV